MMRSQAGERTPWLRCHRNRQVHRSSPSSCASVYQHLTCPSELSIAPKEESQIGGWPRVSLFSAGRATATPALGARLFSFPLTIRPPAVTLLSSSRSLVRVFLTFGSSAARFSQHTNMASLLRSPAFGAAASSSAGSSSSFLSLTPAPVLVVRVVSPTDFAFSRALCVLYSS